jgi:hypothetical protein
MENIELQYSNNGFLMQGIHNGQYLDKNEISKVIFNALEGETLPPEASSPELLGNILHNFSEGWLKPIQFVLGRKGINFTVKGDSYQYNLRENTQMTNEQLRMQMLAGVITEGEYAAIINKKIEEADKESLNESMIGGIVGIGAINQIPATPKADYEMAFEHFLGERYTTNFDNPNQDLEEDDSYNDMDQQISDEVNEVGDDSYKKNLLDLIITGEKQLIDLEKLKGKVPNIDSSIAKAKEVVDGLKASLEGTNEGKEVEEPNNY